MKRRRKKKTRKPDKKLSTKALKDFYRNMARASSIKIKNGGICQGLLQLPVYSQVPAYSQAWKLRDEVRQTVKRIKRKLRQIDRVDFYVGR